LLCKERKAEKERERERIKKINSLSKFLKMKFHSKNGVITKLLKLEWLFIHKK